MSSDRDVRGLEKTEHLNTIWKRKEIWLGHMRGKGISTTVLGDMVEGEKRVGRERMLVITLKRSIYKN